MISTIQMTHTHTHTEEDMPAYVSVFDRPKRGKGRPKTCKRSDEKKKQRAIIYKTSTTTTITSSVSFDKGSTTNKLTNNKNTDNVSLCFSIYVRPLSQNQLSCKHALTILYTDNQKAHR
jgi:hypothetical protein